MLRVSVVIILLFFVALGFTQDIHFSQFTNAPLSLNPSLTGSSESVLRGVLNYKTQWNNVSPNLYQTYSASIDSDVKKDKFGIGAHFLKDIAGTTNMGTLQSSIFISSNVRISKKSSIRVGISGSFTQKIVDQTRLTWESQWESQGFNNNLLSGETNIRNNYHYFDVATGCVFRTVLKENMVFNIGAAGFHLNTPNQGFDYNENNILPVRFNLHSDILIPTNYSIKMKPQILYMKQGVSQEIIGGVQFIKSIGIDSKYTGYNVSSSLLLGLFYRVNDAAIAMVGYNYENYININMSYDLTVSKFSNATSNRGGMELSLIYLFKKKQNTQ